MAVNSGFGDSHPGLIATLAIPALSAATAFSSEVDSGREKKTRQTKSPGLI